MKSIATQFTVPAAALLTMFAFASPARPAQVLVAQATTPSAPAATSPAPATKTAKSRGDRVEARITMLHAKLAITPAQEDLWKHVTEVMRENAQAMETLTKARADKAKTMTAVDDLTSYAELAEAHAAGLKKFVPAFEPLYASMSDAQKAQADTLFRGHGRGHMAAKQMSKSHLKPTAGASNASSTK
jgi:hypothetical protein